MQKRHVKIFARAKSCYEWPRPRYLATRVALSRPCMFDSMRCRRVLELSLIVISMSLFSATPLMYAMPLLIVPFLISSILFQKRAD